MRIRPLAAMAALLVISGAPAARAKGPLTNSELLGQAVHEAVDTLVTGLKLSPGSHVVLLPAPGQTPVWGLENSLAAALRSRGVGHVAFHGPQADSSGGNTPAPGDTVQKDGRLPSIDTRPIDPEAERMEYRVSALGVSYTGAHKKLLIGGTRVDRLARVALAVRQLSPDGSLLGSSQGLAQAGDQVDSDELERLEDNLYQFKNPVAPSRDLSRLLEPAIVVALVTGLVYLFYTNRN